MKLLWLFVAAAALARGEQLTLDLGTESTKIRFELTTHLHTVHGHFNLTRGHVAFDPASGAVSGEIVVDAASGASGNGMRDRYMRKEILESAQYPEIRFLPSKVEGTVAREGASKVQVTGTFEIHGVKHEITIPVDVKITGGQVTGIARFDVPYVAWGMKNPSKMFLRVNETVTIEVEFSGSPRSQ